MKKLPLIIGDVHGKLNEYQNIIQNQERTICVGDFGFQRQWDWHLENVGGQHYINMGNHDYIPYLNMPNSTGNYSYYPQWDIMTIRGADSIDKALRNEGRDWFRDEEMSYVELDSMIEFYETHKPSIVISHDCPQLVMEQLFGYYEKSVTRQALQAAFDIHQPSKWIFGHHHRSKNVTINGTNFVCLKELETYEL